MELVRREENKRNTKNGITNITAEAGKSGERNRGENGTLKGEQK